MAFDRLFPTNEDRVKCAMVGVYRAFRLCVVYDLLFWFFLFIDTQNVSITVGVFCRCGIARGQIAETLVILQP